VSDNKKNMYTDLESYQHTLCAFLGEDLNYMEKYDEVKENVEIQDLLRRIQGTVAIASNNEYAFIVLLSWDYLMEFIQWWSAWKSNESTVEIYKMLAKKIVSCITKDEG